MKEIELWTDGSSLGNGKKECFGGAGAILIFNGKEKELSQPLPNYTNNQAEIYACILGLNALTESCKVNLYTDSNYVLKGMTEWIHGWKRKGWKTQNKGDVKNKDLWIKLDNLCQKHEVTFIKVAAHCGIEYNERADRLAVSASSSLKKD